MRYDGLSDFFRDYTGVVFFIDPSMFYGDWESLFTYILTDPTNFVFYVFNHTYLELDILKDFNADSGTIKGILHKLMRAEYIKKDENISSIEDICFINWRQNSAVCLITQSRMSIYEFATICDIRKKKTYNLFTALIEDNNIELENVREHIRNLNLARAMIATTGDRQIPIPIVPKRLKDNKGHILYIEEEYAAGNEGVIYQTDYDTILLKIYKSPVLYTQISKLKEMVNRHDYLRKIEYVMFPSSWIEAENTIVGFSMKKAIGYTLRNLFFIGKDMNPTMWEFKNTLYEKDYHICIFCISIAETLYKLHDNDMIIGDLSIDNILIDEDFHAVFIDSDSFQYKSFPSTGDKMDYRAEELYHKDLRKQLRLPYNEYFSLAVIFFMIWFGGAHPYQQMGEKSIIERIRDREFPYPYKEKQDCNISKNRSGWLDIWESLPDYIKEAFFNTFYHNKRYSCIKWVVLFIKYLNEDKLNELREELEEKLEEKDEKLKRVSRQLDEAEDELYRAKKKIKRFKLVGKILVGVLIALLLTVIYFLVCSFLKGDFLTFAKDIRLLFTKGV